jgi:hypothetical protein
MLLREKEGFYHSEDVFLDNDIFSIGCNTK